MVARVISSDMSLRKLPKPSFGAFSCRDKDSTDLFTFLCSRQAQFYRQWLQCGIISSEQKCPRCVNTPFLQVNPMEKWHEIVMVIKNEYPPLLHCLFENKRSVEMCDESSRIEFCFSTKKTYIVDPTRAQQCACSIVALQ